MTDLFTYEEGSILLRLLAAHLLTDFYLQRSHWVQSKMKKNLVSGYLWFHTLIAGAMAWLALWSLGYWWVFVITFVTHLLTDAWKIKASRGVQESNLELRQKAQKRFAPLPGRPANTCCCNHCTVAADYTWFFKVW